MYCTRCGKQLEDPAQFCKYCGAPTHMYKDETQILSDSPTENKTSDQPVYNVEAPMNDHKPSGSHLPIFLVICLLFITLALLFLSVAPSGPEGVVFVRWEDAGVQDHVMDWQDENLEKAMRNITMISDRDIMLSDVWEITLLDLNYYDESSAWDISTQDKRIQNITALSELVNLNILYLDGNNISDISALRKLTNLTLLSLNENQIQDVRALRNLVNLATLYLRANQIYDVKELSGLTSLTYLDLSGNQISSVSSLGGSFRFGGNTKFERFFRKICFIRQLRGLIHLTNLNLSANHLSDIAGLQNLSTLYGLNLCDNQISSISMLANLTELNLSYNNISDVDALQNLTYLSRLDLSHNQTSDISALGYLTNLTYLVLNSNDIYDITVLQNLVNLVSVYLWDLPIDKEDISYILPDWTEMYWEENSYTQTMGEALGKEDQKSRTQKLGGQETESKETKEEKKTSQETKKTADSTDKKDKLLNGDYVIADSNSRYLNSSELQKFSLKEINYAKNEIYARRGRKFQSKELRDYFNSKSWYKGTIEPDAFLWDTFNNYEKANAELLSKVEFERDPKGYLLDQ